MTVVLTSYEEISRLFSTAGVDVRLDDADAVTDTELVILDEIIADASETVWQYVWTQYADADISNSTWVRRRATYIAAYFLSQRRGNPSQFIDRYQHIIEELQAVFKRELYIPGLNVNVTASPTVANYIIDNRGIGPVQRVTQDSLETYPGQRTTTAFPLPEVL